MSFKTSRLRDGGLARSPGDPLDLNLRTLDIFVQIAESRAMSSTARRMGLTQPAVSQLVANLESSLGVQLFDRQVRPLALTPSGAILLEKARTLLAMARETISQVREPVVAAYPKLNLCLINTLAGTITPLLLERIQGFAGHWTIHSGVDATHNRALLTREADIVICPDSLEEQTHLERHLILREPFFLALPKSYRGPVESLADLARKMELISFTGRSFAGLQIERHLRRLGIETRGRIELDSSDAVLAMVSKEAGWGLLTPFSALLATGYWHSVRFVPMPEPVLHQRVFVMARKGELGELPRKIAEAAADALKSYLDEKLAPVHPWISNAISIYHSHRATPLARESAPSRAG